MSIKILNKLLACDIQECIKRIIILTKFIVLKYTMFIYHERSQLMLTHHIIILEESHIVILMVVEEMFDKIHH